MFRLNQLEPAKSCQKVNQKPFSSDNGTMITPLPRRGQSLKRTIRESPFERAFFQTVGI